MEFHLLGPLEVLKGDRRLHLGGTKPRCVLAMLLLQVNQVVSDDRLVDDLWGENAPTRPTNTLRVYISGLRRLLEPEGSRGSAGELIARRNPGYVLQVAPEQLDVSRFEAMVAEARVRLAADDYSRAADQFRAALALWRGPFLEDLAYEDFVQASAQRMDEMRLGALEDRIDADLALGRHGELIGEVEALVAKHQLQERLQGQLMIALYRCGRQADALRAFDRARGVLAEELGISPGPTLQQLHQAILAQDPSLDLEPRPRDDGADHSDSRRPYREFGQWLRARRLARRWTVEELAARLGCDESHVQDLEWGERALSQTLRGRLAQLFDLPLAIVPVPSRAPARTSRLPAPPTSLVGREQEMQEVVRLLERARFVTLVGAPGVGKTRLAVAAAQRIDDQLEQGCCFVPLAGVAEADGVMRAIAAAVGLAPESQMEPVARLADYLDGGSILLLLDNFEHVLPAAALVAKLVAEAPGVRVLVTSREPLRVGAETCYPVPPLPVPDLAALPVPAALADAPAIALFVDRVQRVQPAFVLTDDNAPAVAELCVRLDGLPLAIELAAATGRMLSPQSMLTRLDDHLDLPALGPRDVPAHQRTLRATIRWSDALLDEDERALLARLGAFTGGSTLDSAVAVCRLPGEEIDVVAVVAALVGKSLLEPRPNAPGGPRFMMLATIRDYALERLAERGEIEAIRTTHAAYFTDLAERAEPNLLGRQQMHWLDVLDDEHANLKAALAWCAQEAPGTALRLAGALWRFWWMRGHLTEGRAWLEHALHAAESRSPERVRALNGAGVLARSQNDYPQAVALFRAASALSEELGIEDGLALALINLGLVAENQGRYEEAEDLFDRCLSVYRDLDDVRGVAHALNCRGMVKIDLGDYADVVEILEQSRAVFRDTGDLWSLALVTTNLGWVAFKQDDATRAEGWYEQSLSICRRLGDQHGVARALSNLARVALREGDTPAAVALLEDALLLFRRLGARRDIAECLEELAGTAEALGDGGRAARLLGAAQGFREAIGAPLWPSEREDLARTITNLRSHLDARDFARHWAEGHALTLDEAVALALSRGA